MKRNSAPGIVKSCAVCEHAKREAITGELLCTRKKSLKVVGDGFFCRKFSLDLLSIRPTPARLPKFDVESTKDIII